jgi:hypothetical protein
MTAGSTSGVGGMVGLGEPLGAGEVLGLGDAVGVGPGGLGDAVGVGPGGVVGAAVGVAVGGLVGGSVGGCVGVGEGSCGCAMTTGASGSERACAGPPASGTAVTSRAATTARGSVKRRSVAAGRVLTIV